MRGRGRPVRAAAESGAVLGLLAAVYVLQVLGILAGGTALVVVGGVLGALTEGLLVHRERVLARRLGRAQFTAPVRQLLRDGLFLGGLARLDVLRPGGQGAWLLVAVLGCWALHFLCQAVAGAVRTRHRLPVVTRNIDAHALRPTRSPPALFVRHGTLRLTGVGVLTAAGMAVSAGTGDPLWAEIVAVCCCAALLVGTFHLATWLLPRKRVVDDEAALAWLDDWLADYRPTVGMYFSGGTSSAYQANMWLSTLAALEERPLIVLRERFMVQKIDATDVPIVCIPKVAHLMHLEHSTLKVLLHPANSGKTSQVLRIPTLKHAFINHGESDKLSSCNPYAKAYDQVWVAGEAARERYQVADIGVEDKDVVEVGRPQLAPIRPYEGPPRGTYTTVLYAPTWEGWTEDPGNTSVLLAGEALVAALLEDPKVRLLYKPHPMTGSVDPRVGAADHRIRDMVARANAARASERHAPVNERPAPEAAGELERATRALDELTRADFGPGSDEVERMLRQPAPHAGRAREAAEATARWEAAYWDSLPEGEHQVVLGPRPALFSCFNQTDLLISDVSSVVSDYLSSEKPYAVANTSGLREDAFRAAYPTVRAATILPPDGAGIAELLETVRHPERDTLAPARAALKVRLLGPDEPPSLVRFNRAVRSLAAAAHSAHMPHEEEQAPERRPVDAEGEVEAEGKLNGSQTFAEALGDDERLF
ncbi:hypothetical protein [Streptomyces iconiensis]|uniref:hypothetical protein n=1 Tax=Streptomyces iconiensis TaxID=1384038 RepID=UPI002360944F